MSFGNNQYSQFSGGGAPAASAPVGPARASKGWSCRDTIDKATSPFDPRGFFNEEAAEESDPRQVMVLWSKGMKATERVTGKVKDYLKHQVKTYKIIRRHSKRMRMTMAK
jgi:hypothetical protein